MNPKKYWPIPSQPIFCIFHSFREFVPGINRSPICLLDTEVLDRIMFHLFLWIGIKTNFEYTEIDPNRVPKYLRVATLDQLLENTTPISHKAFSYPNFNEKYSLHVQLISLRLPLSASLAFCRHPKEYDVLIYFFLDFVASISSST